MACFSWLRHETDPAWGNMLTPGLLTYLKQGLAYLTSCGSNRELPTQRVVNKSAKLGNVTIRVTPARSARIGSLGIVLPHQTGKLPHDETLGPSGS
jgi:hypothetical protein